MSIISQTLRKSNRYFFGEDVISLHDFVWFYGVYVLGFSALVLILAARLMAGS